MPAAKSATISPGLAVGQIVRPLDVVAAYIPAGRYPLPSTLMMTVIPAQVAGVPTVCVTSPRAGAEIFGTASLLGVAECVPARRRAGDRGVRLRHEDGSARGSHRRSGKHLCRRREEAARRRSRHRLHRRSDGDPDHRQRRRARRGSPPTCSRRPSTTSTPRRSC